MTPHIPPQPAAPASATATRAAIALEFETLTDAQVDQAIRLAIIDLGGTWIPVPASGHWGPVEHEISLLGVCATGHTLAAAARSWTRRALRVEITRQQEENAA